MEAAIADPTMDQSQAATDDQVMDEPQLAIVLSAMDQSQAATHDRSSYGSASGTHIVSAIEQSQGATSEYQKLVCRPCVVYLSEMLIQPITPRVGLGTYSAFKCFNPCTLLYNSNNVKDYIFCIILITNLSYVDGFECPFNCGKQLCRTMVELLSHCERSTRNILVRTLFTCSKMPLFYIYTIFSTCRY